MTVPEALLFQRPARNPHTELILAKHRRVVESTEFEYFGMRLVALPGVFCPAIAESGPLVTEYLSKRDGIPARSVLEVGCGSGAQTVILAQRSPQLTALDINPDAVAATCLNLERYNLHGHVRIVVSDLFSELPRQTFDLIVADLPFANGPASDMLEKAFYDCQHRTLRRFLRSARSWLRKEGRILLTFASLGCATTLHLFLRRYRYRIEELFEIRARAIDWQLFRLVTQ